jgi:hypothetical protein
VGIDVHSLNFLRFCKRKKLLGNTLTLGRQRLNISNNVISKILNVKTEYSLDVFRLAEAKFCEKLLVDHFGSIKVDSIDNSNYENATYVYDMNVAIPENLHMTYDSVIDCGTLEHVYNIPQAFKNCSSLLKPGGQIIHISPANNYCGHGFWQFSPELFFSLYSEENGYKDTEVFLADMNVNNKWFQVSKPAKGNRVNITSTSELYVMVRSVLGNEKFNHNHVQQSDYVHKWVSDSGVKDINSTEKSFYQKVRYRIQAYPMVFMITQFLFRIFLTLRGVPFGTRLDPRRKDLKVTEVNGLT